MLIWEFRIGVIRIGASCLFTGWLSVFACVLWVVWSFQLCCVLLILIIMLCLWTTALWWLLLFRRGLRRVWLRVSSSTWFVCCLFVFCFWLLCLTVCLTFVVDGLSTQGRFRSFVHRSAQIYSHWSVRFALIFLFCFIDRVVCAPFHVCFVFVASAAEQYFFILRKQRPVLNRLLTTSAYFQNLFTAFIVVSFMLVLSGTVNLNILVTTQEHPNYHDMSQGLLFWFLCSVFVSVVLWRSFIFVGLFVVCCFLDLFYIGLGILGLICGLSSTSSLSGPVDCVLWLFVCLLVCFVSVLTVVLLGVCSEYWNAFLNTFSSTNNKTQQSQQTNRHSIVFVVM